LKEARALGDILLVSVTADEHVRKRHGRPLIPQELRAENLAALECVDWVYIEPGPTAADLLEAVRPDVYAKGREYEYGRDPRFGEERRIVERHGGRVAFTSGETVLSSTALIEAAGLAAAPNGSRLADLLDRPELQAGPLLETIAAFRGVRVVVIGDAILDTYVFCDSPEVQGHEPVLTLRPRERRRFDGGAAIIARHVAAMGARPILVTALPDSDEGRAIGARLAAAGVDVRAVRSDGAIAEKQRFLAGTQKVLKLDPTTVPAIEPAEQGRLLHLAADVAADAAIIADFAQGLLDARAIGGLCDVLRPCVRVLAGDVSGPRTGLRHMRAMDLLCPSDWEARAALGMPRESLAAVGAGLLAATRSRAAVLTRAAEGLTALTAAGDSEELPALSVSAVDPLGCGDALLAASTLALAAGATLLAGAFLGSIAAAAEAQHLGNIPISAADLRRGVMRLHGAPPSLGPHRVQDEPLADGRPPVTGSALLAASHSM
jgi:rfaE bifunctional protein kinase chain/domain